MKNQLGQSSAIYFIYLFTCPAARGVPEQKAPSPACLLHHGEHLPALELMVVLLRKCHGEATLGSRSEIRPLSNQSPGNVQSILFICREKTGAAPPGIK